MNPNNNFYFKEFVGNRILLRTPTINDTYKILNYFIRNKEHLSPYEPKKPIGFYTKDFWQKGIVRINKDMQNNNSLRMFLFEKSNQNTVIGTLNFTEFVMYPVYKCMVGYSLDKHKEGLGYMTEALKLAINYMFSNLNFHRIYAEHMPSNAKSENLLHRLGFVTEGCMKDSVLINGKWEDHNISSLINPNWKNPI